MIAFARMEGADGRPPHEWLAQVRPQEQAPDDRPFLFLNMVASADGRAARDGRAGGLGSAADTLMLTELRALPDAVLLGTGTVRAEGYARLVAHPDRVARRRAAGLADTPLAVLISRSFDFPWDAQLFTAEDQPVLLYAGAPGEVPAAVTAPVEVVHLAEPSPSAAMADLRARGVRALLCEGGPTLNRSLLAAGVVDELFLTIAPLLTGDDEQLRIVQGAPLSAPSRLRLIWALQQEDELYLRYAVLHAE